MRNSTNFNQFSLQVKARMISYVISCSCIISKVTSVKIYFLFWMKGAKTSIKEKERDRKGERERDVHSFFLECYHQEWRCGGWGRRLTKANRAPSQPHTPPGPRRLSCLDLIQSQGVCFSEC